MSRELQPGNLIMPYEVYLCTLQVLSLSGLTAAWPDTSEQEGFEPPVPIGTAVFKTAALSHSATAPNRYAVLQSILPTLKDLQSRL